MGKCAVHALHHFLCSLLPHLFHYLFWSATWELCLHWIAPMCIYICKIIRINLHFCKSTFAGKRDSGLSGHFGIKLGRNHSGEEGEWLFFFSLPSLFHCLPITTSSAPYFSLVPDEMQVPADVVAEKGGRWDTLAGKEDYFWILQLSVDSGLILDDFDSEE